MNSQLKDMLRTCCGVGPQLRTLGLFSSVRLAPANLVSGPRTAMDPALSLSFRLPSFQAPSAAIPPGFFPVSGSCRRIPGKLVA